MEELQRLKERREELKKQLSIYAENDPDIIDQLQKQVKTAKTAANRWTDAIFTIQSYAKGKVSIPVEELNKGLGIPGDLDYIE